MTFLQSSKMGQRKKGNWNFSAVSLNFFQHEKYNKERRCDDQEEHGAIRD